VGQGKLEVISVNILETSNSYLKRMLRGIDPKIAVISGTDQIIRDFDGVESIPAAYLFNAEGKEVFRVGGDPGPPGRHYITARELAREVGNLR
jgi:hypothetical protein